MPRQRKPRYLRHFARFNGQIWRYDQFGGFTMIQVMAKSVGTWHLVCHAPDQYTDSADTDSEAMPQVATESFIGQLLDTSGDEHYCSWGWQSLPELVAHLENAYRLLTSQVAANE